ncbi:SDR family oxidoreductase [Oceanicoccus sp. KOV_DT_Chl]|uniref:SDR family oxidoreductase n=1 Tax=Oceanicoccus sp. KOV_DT_Chl TaxID=1904639 RepID=UPI0013578616|nr:SDR family oxidoreductase [Oceanicoccus sp. KOV_DT_Chl]
MKKVLVAGATGYLGKFAVQAFKQQGYYVRVLTRSEERLYQPGPFTAPALTKADFDEVFLGEVTKPDTLVGMLDDIDIVFSCVGISRQRDGLTFEQVDYQCNKSLIDLCAGSSVTRFTYVSMQGAENIMQLAITKAHEKVVGALKTSGLEYRIVRPCGYFSDMGAVFDMAKKGRAFLVGAGTNKMNPIYGGDLAQACVEITAGDELEVEVGGPDIMTQREVVDLAFEVVGKPVKVTVIPMWLARGLVKFIGLLSTQFGDLADFIVTAGEIDGVGPRRGTTTLRSYFEQLNSA